jgi:hypothetical protein
MHFAPELRCLRQPPARLSPAAIVDLGQSASDKRRGNDLIQRSIR